MPSNDDVKFIHRLPDSQMRTVLADIFGIVANLMKICEIFVMGEMSREEMLDAIDPSMRDAMVTVLDKSTGVDLVTGVSEAVTVLLKSLEHAWSFAIFDGSAFTAVDEDKRPRGEWVAEAITGEMVFVEYL